MSLVVLLVEVALGINHGARNEIRCSTSGHSNPDQILHFDLYQSSLELAKNEIE